MMMMLAACLICIGQSVEKVLYFDKSIYIVLRVTVTFYYYYYYHCLIMHNFVLAYIRFYILV